MLINKTSTRNRDAQLKKKGIIRSHDTNKKEEEEKKTINHPREKKILNDLLTITVSQHYVLHLKDVQAVFDQQADSAIRRINRYPADKQYEDKLRYPLNSDLSSGYRQPPQQYTWLHQVLTNQSARKTMGYCFWDHVSRQRRIRHQFVHVTHFDQSESSKGFACFNPWPFAVELAELVCACVNLSNCAPVPSHGWQYIRKHRVLNRTSNGCRYPQNLFPDSSHWEG